MSEVDLLSLVAVCQPGFLSLHVTTRSTVNMPGVWRGLKLSLCKKPEPDIFILIMWALLKGETKTCSKIQFMVAKKADLVELIQNSY